MIKTAFIERIERLVPESEREDFSRGIMERYLGIAVLSGALFFCLGFLAGVALMGVLT